VSAVLEAEAVQQLQAVVFKGERRYMMYAIGKLVEWRVQMHQIVVEDDVTHIYVQAPAQVVDAIHKAFKKENDDRHRGLN
jgi:peptidyl-tRNA hydrolase